MKNQLMNAHRALVAAGEYEQARMILKLLRRGILRLGLEDASAALEILLDGLGMTPHYSRNYCVATYTLRG